MGHDDLVVVLGAGPGLGVSVSRAFAQTGAHVVMMARRVERLARLAEEIQPEVPGLVSHVVVDVTDEVALRGAFAAVRDRHGDPTVLVHNPSIAYEAPPTRTPLDALLDGVRLAAGSLLVAAQEVAPAMRAAGHGTILVTGNRAATTGSTWSAGLAVQKAAARNLAQSLAAELGPDGVRVTVITIDGLLGSPGLEYDNLAAQYVHLHDAPASDWVAEFVWPPAG